MTSPIQNDENYEFVRPGLYITRDDEPVRMFVVHGEERAYSIFLDEWQGKQAFTVVDFDENFINSRDEVCADFVGEAIIFPGDESLQRDDTIIGGMFANENGCCLACLRDGEETPVFITELGFDEFSGNGNCCHNWRLECCYHTEFWAVVYHGLKGSEGLRW